MAAEGQVCVCAENLLGNDGADTAVDIGKLLRQDEAVFDARRRSSRIVVGARRAASHDGRGRTALDAMVWDTGVILKKHTKGRPSSLLG